MEYGIWNMEYGIWNMNMLHDFHLPAYGDYFEREGCPCPTSIPDGEDCLAADF
jgi:hypothetical protein